MHKPWFLKLDAVYCLSVHSLWKPASVWKHLPETYTLSDNTLSADLFLWDDCVQYDTSSSKGGKKDPFVLHSSSIRLQYRTGTASCRRQGERQELRGLFLWVKLVEAGRREVGSARRPHENRREPASAQRSPCGGWQRPGAWYRRREWRWGQQAAFLKGTGAKPQARCTLPPPICGSAAQCLLLGGGK